MAERENQEMKMGESMNGGTNEMNKKHIISFLNFSNAAAGLALAIAAITFYFQFWRQSSEAYVSIAQPEWSVDQGRFGSGPKLGFVGVFLNVGNRPMIVQSVSISSEPIFENSEQENCILAKGSLGLPWKSRFDGADISDAIAFSVSGEGAQTGYWNFEATPSMIKNAPECRTSIGILKITLSFRTLDFRGTWKITKVELGTVRYTLERMFGFDGAPNLSKLVKISN